MPISPTRNGRWKVEAVCTKFHGYDDWNTFTVRDARNCCIAVVGEVDHLPAPENADNARLMAAAPALLEALQDCYSELNQLAFLSGDKLSKITLNKARAIIASLKG